MSNIQDQLKTIQENAERIAHNSTDDPRGCGCAILAALAQLEAMVGQQEPIGEVVAIDSGDDEDGPHAIVALYGEVQLEAKLYTAAPVAQQPQARPDFADEWTGYLKDGETPFERFLRERKDLTALTKLYQRALEENERLKAQQPQADTPQATTIAEAARDVGKWLNERPNRPIDLRHVAMLVAHAMQPQAEPDAYCITTPDGGCISTDPRCMHQPQAEAVPELTDSQIMASVGRNAGGPYTSISESRPLGQQWTQICALVRHIIRERYCGAAPQQAEAVPTGYVSAPVNPTPEILRALGNKWDGANAATWQRVIAAIAKQKGSQ